MTQEEMMRKLQDFRTSRYMRDDDPGIPPDEDYIRLDLSPREATGLVLALLWGLSMEVMPVGIERMYAVMDQVSKAISIQKKGVWPDE